MACGGNHHYLCQGQERWNRLRYFFTTLTNQSPLSGPGLALVQRWRILWSSPAVWRFFINNIIWIFWLLTNNTIQLMNLKHFVTTSENWSSAFWFWSRMRMLRKSWKKRQFYLQSTRVLVWDRFGHCNLLFLKGEEFSGAFSMIWFWNVCKWMDVKSG